MNTRVLTAIVLGAALADAAPAQHNSSAWADSVRREWRARLEADASVTYNTTAILVRFAPDDGAEQRAKVRALVGDGWLEQYPFETELVHVRGSIPQAVERVRPFVIHAEPDWVLRVASIPNDPQFATQWGLRNTGQTVNGDPGTAGADIRADVAWNTSSGDPSFVIAVIDTGVQWSHPDLAANIWTNPGEVAGNAIDDDGNGWIDDVRGWDFYDNDNNPTDGNGHGTAVAGILGAVGNNNLGVTGVNQHCKIMPVRFSGPSGGTVSTAISSVYYAAGRELSGVGTWNASKVSNNAWGASGSALSGQALQDAITWAGGNGHLFVCAAGNDGVDITTGSSFFPAAFNLPNMIAVAATDNDDQLTSFSNFSSTLVHLGAPSDNANTTDLTGSAGYSSGDYVYFGGTSSSSSFVAGVAALVKSVNPGFTYQQVRYRVLSTARPVSDLAGVTVTGGIVNAAEAVSPGSTMPGTPYCSGNPGDPAVTTTCPCSNPGAPGHGCASSAVPAGARLVAGGTINPDTVVLFSTQELPSVLSIFLQGNLNASAGLVFGDGVRCVNGNMKRLYTKNAVNGAVSAPGMGDPSITARSAALGDPIPPAAIRYYQVYYRDSNLVFCAGGFNVSNGMQISW